MLVINQLSVSLLSNCIINSLFIQQLKFEAEEQDRYTNQEMSLNDDTLWPTIGRLDVYTEKAPVGDRRAVFTYRFLARYLDWWANRCKRTKGHSHDTGPNKLLHTTS